MDDTIETNWMVLSVYFPLVNWKNIGQIGSHSLESVDDAHSEPNLSTKKIKDIYRMLMML